MRKLVIALVLWAGCGDKKGEQQPGTGSASASATGSASASAAGSASASAAGSASASAAGSASASAVVAIDAGVVAVDASLLGDLPPLSLAELDEATIKKSVNLNNVGYAAHKKKDWPAAEAGYIDAVKADPGNLRARFNLACVYSSSDQADKAFAVLSQFKVPDCRACDAVLLKAKTDHEWAARVTDPRFVALQEGITAEPTDIKKGMVAVIDAIRTKKPERAALYIHPRNPIKVSELQYSEDPWKELFYGPPGFARLVKEIIGKIDEDDIRSCAKNCCNTDVRGDDSNVVDQVCFDGAGDVLFVSSIVFDFGPI